MILELIFGTAIISDICQSTIENYYDEIDDLRNEIDELKEELEYLREDI